MKPSPALARMTAAVAAPRAPALRLAARELAEADVDAGRLARAMAYGLGLDFDLDLERDAQAELCAAARALLEALSTPDARPRPHG